MPQRELYEQYPLEILSRAKTVEKRCASLLNNEFISDTPRIFARTIENMCGYLAKAVPVIYGQIEWNVPETEIEQSLKQLRNTDRILQHLALQLRFVEGALTQRLPWSIVPSFELLVGRFLPDVHIMLRAMWRYNYSFLLADQRSKYLDLLSEYPDYLPDVDLESNVLGEMKVPFHIVSFPSLERKHILLHSLLGHEIGHLLIDEYVATRADGFAIMARAALEQRSSGRQDSDAITRDLLKASEYWRRALEEILADLAGTMLFGPAALFATLEMALQGGFDVTPTERNEYYPPWRRRLREVWSLLETTGGWFPLPETLFDEPSRVKLVNDRVREIADLVGVERDLEFLKHEPLAKLAYDSVRDEIPLGIEYLLNERRLAAQQPKPSQLFKLIPRLVERLDCLLPPNAYEKSANEVEPVDFVDIINAAWIHRVTLSTVKESVASGRGREMEIDKRSGIGSPQPVDEKEPASNTEVVGEQEAIKKRDTANNLTLKAIEYSELAREYREWPGSKSSEIDLEKTVERAGVLTRDEIAEWMKHPLRDRLVITPLLNPKESIGPSSVDVRLGSEFLVFKREAFRLLDVGQQEWSEFARDLASQLATVIVPKASEEDRRVAEDAVRAHLAHRFPIGFNDGAETARYQERVVKPYGRPFVLHPRQLVIGSTLEYVQLPRGLMCYVIGKSGWGRMGLVIATATKVDPGYQGCIALEIINEGEVPVVLYPGLPIAQLVLHQTSGNAVYNGSYHCPIGPQFPKLTPPDRRWRFWLQGPRR